jgi:hypothetical protein
MPVRTTVADDMARARRNDIPVKLDAEVVRAAKIVAAFRDQSLAEYLSEKLRPLVLKDLAQHKKEDGPYSPKEGGAR